MFSYVQLLATFPEPCIAKHYFIFVDVISIQNCRSFKPERRVGIDVCMNTPTGNCCPTVSIENMGRWLVSCTYFNDLHEKRLNEGSCLVLTMRAR